MIVSIVLTLLAAAPVAPRMAAFGYQDRWVLVDLDTYQTRRLGLNFTSEPISSISIAGDGRALAFTVPTPGSLAPRSDRLFYWSGVPTEAPVALTRSGHAESATFSADSKWIYFAHHPDGAPMSMHQPGKYLQIYKIKISGTELTQLTNTRGCHYGVASMKSRLFFIHASCSPAPDVIAELRSGREATWPGDALKYLESSALSDNSGLLVTSVRPDGVSVWSTRGNAKPVHLFDVPGAREIQLKSGKNSGEVVFLQGAAITLWANNKMTRIAEVEHE